MHKPLPLLILGGFVGAACASSPPAKQVQAASASIRAAEEVGATHIPQASLHLQLAKEQFEHASKLTDSGDRPRAARLLLRAQADADLALALARTEAEKAEARAAIEKVRSLSESGNTN